MRRMGRCCRGARGDMGRRAVRKPATVVQLTCIRCDKEGMDVAKTTMIQIALLVVAVMAGIFAAVCAKKNRSQYIEGCIYAGVVAIGLAIILGIG